MLNNELLNNELKKNPFTVPDNYFDVLPSKVQDRCIVSRKKPVYGFIPKLALSGGIMVLILALFLSYLNFNKSVKKQDTGTLVVETNERTIDPTSADSQKKYLKSYRDGMVEYLAVRNVNLNDYLVSRY